MSEPVLAALCGGLLAAVLALLVLLWALQRSARQHDETLGHALSATTLWWWRCDAGGRVNWARAGRRRPDWLDPEPLLGRPFWVLPGAPELPAPDALAAILATRQPFFDLPLEARSSSGAPLALRLGAEPCYDRFGRFRGYAGATRLAEAAAPVVPDMARRLALIEQERAQERAEQLRQFELASKELESFSYAVSHDLRAPLRVVDGFAGIILEDYGGRLDDLGREHVQRIVAAAARMNAMIDALLAMSRRTARELDIEPVDLSRAAGELAEELRASDFQREVRFDIQPELRAEGDPVLLRLVLQNLLGNAFKFTAKVAQARIEFGRRSVDGTEAYFVRDNGAGFDMRFAERLFGLFQRLHSPNDFAGTGVGLATVQRIVRKHGGRVWAESEPGKGACFYFTLPHQAA